MNRVYPNCAEIALTAFFADTPSIVAVDAAYVYNDLHFFLDEIITIGDVVALTSPAFTGGVLTADPPTITGLSPSDVVAGIVVFNDTGTPSSSALGGFADLDSIGAVINYTSDGTGLLISFPGVTILSL